MSVREFAHISKVIRGLIRDGYTNDDFAILLDELNMYDDRKSYDDIIELLRCYDNVGRDGDYHFFAKLVNMVGTERILEICDELSISSIVTRIIRLPIIMLLHLPQRHIINASSDDIILEYEMGYRIIGDAIQFTDDSTSIINLCNYKNCTLTRIYNAYCNGLYESNVSILSSSDYKCDFDDMLSEFNEIAIAYDDSMFDILSKCTNLKKLHIYGLETCNSDADIDKFATMCRTKTLELVTGEFINDKYLSVCVDLVKLNATNNSYITTCAPFAKTLTILCAAWCNINDDGLKLCTNIRKLDMSYNNRITTCAPFAKKLKKLNVSYTKIDNIGIALCTNLKILIAVCSPNITTCAPFAKTLNVLHAVCSCGIGDDGLNSCINIKKLDASVNSKITTCEPFAKSLKHLWCARSGININDIIKYPQIIVNCDDVKYRYHYDPNRLR